MFIRQNRIRTVNPVAVGGGEGSHVQTQKYGILIKGPICLIANKQWMKCVS